MREILFRGKRKDNGEWIENHILVELRDGQKYIPNNFAPSGLKIDENGNRVSFVALFHEVIPETVGQYIGANDKNHKEIYEGDIVKTCDNHIYRIKWDNQRAMFYLRNDITHASADFYHYFASDLEIIGNITDNPELLKGGENNDEFRKNKAYER